MNLTIFDKIKMGFQRIGWRFIVKRFISMIPTIFIIITIIFVMIRSVDGGPFDAEKKIPDVIKEKLEEKYNLNKPIFFQYLDYLGDIIFRFDFGPSYHYRAYSVNDIVGMTLPVSLSIGFYAILIALIIGVTAGTISALKPNSIFDYAAMSVALLGISTPLFVIAPLLILLFARSLGWLPVAGWGNWYNYIIPVITLSFPYTAYVARLTKAGMLDNIRKEFVTTARAKGLSERRILFKHVLKGSLIPVVSYLGPAFAGIITGSMVVESICGVPGMGSDFVKAAFNRDYTLISGIMITYSTMLIIMNFLVDVVYTFLDPRTKYN